MNPTVDTLTDICRIVAAVIVVRKLDAKRLGAVVACLRDNGGECLANILIGELPFDVGPSPSTLERLTDE